jgi:hypothetical protein
VGESGEQLLRSLRRQPSKGAPACPGVPWGLAFETWVPSNLSRRAVGQCFMDTRDVTTASVYRLKPRGSAPVTFSVNQMPLPGWHAR